MPKRLLPILFALLLVVQPTLGIGRTKSNLQKQKSFLTRLISTYLHLTLNPDGSGILDGGVAIPANSPLSPLSGCPDATVGSILPGMEQQPYRYVVDKVCVMGNEAVFPDISTLNKALSLNGIPGPRMQVEVEGTAVIVRMPRNTSPASDPDLFNVIIGVTLPNVQAYNPDGGTIRNEHSVAWLFPLNAIPDDFVVKGSLSLSDIDEERETEDLDARMVANLWAESKAQDPQLLIRSPDALALFIGAFPSLRAIGTASKMAPRAELGLRIPRFAPVRGSMPRFAKYRFRQAKTVNNQILSKDPDWHPPYKQWTLIREGELGREHRFVRVHSTLDNAKRVWIMREEDIRGLTAAQIKDKFAIPGEALPQYITDVTVHPNARLRTGIANSHPKGGRGGGVQYELFDTSEATFTNTRLLTNANQRTIPKIRPRP